MFFTRFGSEDNVSLIKWVGLSSFLMYFLEDVSKMSVISCLCFGRIKPSHLEPSGPGVLFLQWLLFVRFSLYFSLQRLNLEPNICKASFLPQSYNPNTVNSIFVSDIGFSFLFLGNLCLLRNDLFI